MKIDVLPANQRVEPGGTVALFDIMQRVDFVVELHDGAVVLVRGENIAIVDSHNERDGLSLLDLGVEHVDGLRGRDTQLVEDLLDARLASRVDPRA